MKRLNKTFSVLVAAGVMLIAAPSTLRAEKAGPTGEATDFFPGATAVFYDPQAAGTKFSGTLAVAYDKGPSSGTECNPFLINRMSVVLVLEHGTDRKAFTTAEENFCFDDQVKQVNVIINLVREKVIPFFYGGCDPNIPDACPGFKVKALTNFVFTTPDSTTDPNTVGGNSAEITLAVQ